VDEIYQAYLIRSDYLHRGPTTVDHRINLKHDLGDMSTVHQICTSLGYKTLPLDTSQARNERTLAMLKVAVRLAS
jgi:hypothetical protein